MALPDADVERFWRDGYLLIKRVFPLEEIEAARASIEEILRTEGGRRAVDAVVGERDLLSYPQLQRWVYDERVLAVVRRVLGSDEPIYFGDSSFQTGRGDRGWHKDNRVVDRFDHSGLDWNGRYPLLRVGIYLQDHARHSGGLGIRVGSHRPFWAAQKPLPSPWRRRASKLHGRPIFVDSEPGDLVIWNLRTTHTGNSVRMKLLPWLKLSAKNEARIPAWLSLEEERKRAAMFATYAAKSEHLDRYVDYLKTREYALDLWRKARVTDEVREAAKEKGLTVMKVEA